MSQPIVLPEFELSERPIGVPMLCHAGSLDVVPNDPALLASWKEDGWRALAAVTDTTSVLRSREGHQIAALPYIANYLATLAPAGSVFDGELVDRARPGQLRRTGTILKSAAPHVPTAADPAITFAIFDVLFIAGEDLRDQPLHERLRRLHELLAPSLPDMAADAAHPIVLLEDVPSTPEFAQAALDAGKEGIVVKHRDSLYRHGSRSDWWRYKPQETIDARCTGVVRDGARGPVSSLAFELDNKATGQVSSGLSDRDRQHVAEDPDTYIGQLLELAHHGFEKRGALRHPVYLGVRHPDDKAAPPKRRARAARTVDAAKVAAGPSNGPGKPRNYHQMGDKKLLAAETSLETRTGDAYEKCMEKHSQDPDGDLAIVRAEIKRRKLR